MPQDPAPDPRFQSPSDEVEAILQKALVHSEDEAWDAVAELLRTGLVDHPGDPYLLCWLGMAERELGMDGIAYERFKQALAVAVEDPVLLATAGNALAGFDDPAAEAALRTAALLAPELAQARWMYGAYLAREGITSQALVELDAAVALDPEDPVIRIERGTALALAGELEEACIAFATAGELDSEDGWGMILLGLARLQLGDLEEAARTLEAGARIRPEDIEAQLLASLALSALGWEDRAWELLERARIRADVADQGIVAESEAHIEDGPEAARTFLEQALGPSSFRERLLERP